MLSSAETTIEASATDEMLRIRDAPDDVQAELRRRASAAGMSLSDFAGQELARRPSLADLLDRAARRTGDRMTFSEAREAISAERPPECTTYRQS